MHRLASPWILHTTHTKTSIKSFFNYCVPVRLNLTSFCFTISIFDVLLKVLIHVFEKIATFFPRDFFMERLIKMKLFTSKEI